MLRRGFCLVLGLLSLWGAPALAQQAEFSTGVPVETGERPSAVVTLDRARLFEETLMGRAIQARLDSAAADLVAENRRLEAALEAEERQLTAQRATLAPEVFRDMAQEFDTRVEDLRVAQEAKSRALTRSRDAEQQRFFQLAVPVLARLMEELGAVAIIERSVVILSFDRIDITTQAIARLDADLGDGSALPDLGEGEAAPPSPEPSAQP